MTHEHGLHRRQWRFDALCSAVNSCQQTIRPPFHDGLPNSVFGREVTEQRALGQVHVLGDDRGRDLAGVIDSLHGV